MIVVVNVQNTKHERGRLDAVDGAGDDGLSSGSSSENEGPSPAIEPPHQRQRIQRREKAFPIPYNPCFSGDPADIINRPFVSGETRETKRIDRYASTAFFTRIIPREDYLLANLRKGLL